MGSISSRPPAPQPQIITVPATPAPTAAAQNTSEDTTTDSTTEQSSETQNRAASLLQRDRSRFGTILTGFRGLLSQNSQAAQRKTLLGE